MTLTTPRSAAPPSPAVSRPYRISVRQYLKMIGAGVFPEGARVELLGGILVEKMTKYTPHNFSVGQLADTLRSILGAAWVVREEKSVVLGRFDRPEPDIAVVRGPRSNYRRRDPGPRDIAFLVEIADSSYPDDRGEKWRRYASARVEFYWIMNIPARVIEVYSGRSGRGPAARYRSCAAYAEDAEVPVVIDGREVGRVAVRDVLP